LKPSEERIENPCPIVVNPSGVVAVGTATVRLRDIFNLGVQHCFLKLPEQVLCILELEPQITMTLVRETETVDLMCPPAPCLGCRFGDDPNFHGNSPGIDDLP
jgi:hypothetical protein